jgi:extracellular factor (EF) 3-hydroxypalmitic acid methyl ester biosynthesis protein
VSRALAVDGDHRASHVRRVAIALAAEIRAIDRRLRRAGQTVPAADVKQHLARRFWEFVELAAEVESEMGIDLALRAECREILGRWLFRSRYFNRSYHKPHGFAGDFMIIEWSYDLENDPCADPAQPGIVNALDHVFSTVDAVVSLWQRRRWFARLLHAERRRLGGRLRVLDLACGGARYIRDFLETGGDVSGVELTLVDQDAAALAFCRTRSLAPWTSRIETRLGSVVRLDPQLRERRFDLIISAGLFDYLGEAVARNLLDDLASLLAPGGVVALSNFHVSDRSRVVKDWLLDWPLIYRDDTQCAGLLPRSLAVAIERASNGALCYATGRAPA